MSREKFSGSEANLCASFIEQFNAIDGWTCYPETADFDVLVVHEDGRQIGVEAKLKLNAKVADQILPSKWDARYASPGPDHRLVIVGDITDSSRGIAKALEMLGVEVICPRMNTRRRPCKELGHTYESFPDFRLMDLFQGRGHPGWGEPHLFDWNPPERCKVPIVVPDVPAGVPSPLRLTPWKESALQVLILLRKQGFITAKQISHHGISPSVWTQGSNAWLSKGSVQGQWVATERLPAFDQQHPEAYAKLMEMVESEQQLALSQ